MVCSYAAVCSHGIHKHIFSQHTVGRPVPKIFPATNTKPIVCLIVGHVVGTCNHTSLERGVPRRFTITVGCSGSLKNILFLVLPSPNVTYVHVLVLLVLTSVRNELHVLIPVIRLCSRLCCYIRPSVGLVFSK